MQRVWQGWGGVGGLVGVWEWWVVVSPCTLLASRETRKNKTTTVHRPQTLHRVVTPIIRPSVRFFVCAGRRDAARRDTAGSPSRLLLSELGACSRGEPLVLEAKLGGVDGRENWWRERPPLPPAWMRTRARIALAFGLVGDTSRRVDGGGAASDGAETASAQPIRTRGCSAAGG